MTGAVATPPGDQVRGASRPRVISPRIERHLAAALGVAALLAAGASALGSRLLWNRTPSLPLGLYWLSRSGRVKPGVIVAFPVPGQVRDLVRERKYLPPGALLAKRVVAQEGDTVCTEGGRLTVNGEVLGTVLTEDSATRALPHAHLCGPLPEGVVFVASNHPKSFDSRTFGPIALTSIRGVVTPIWTY